ncbi:MAG TPA: altronate dehydratase family protein [Aggregatilineales bacterium]|nr:altronate dehydratase family protein [Aggregatilineales bacterium]
MVANVQLHDDNLDKTFRLIRLHESDNIGIARSATPAGSVFHDTRLRPTSFIPSGHKVALSVIHPGEPVYRYGHIIGFATRLIEAGEHVHTQNLAADPFARPHSTAQDDAEAVTLPWVTADTDAGFEGYLRSDGRVGTRNLIAVMATVNCSAYTVREIARHFRHDRLQAYPGVDGVIAITHAFGCAVQIGGDDYQVLQRTLRGILRHPNIAACIVVGLGCETNQADALLSGLEDAAGDGPRAITIQDQGSVRSTIAAGIAAVEAALPEANQHRRTWQPLSKLTIALQCGGSDSWSGISANPLLGRAVDQLIRQGGTAVLAETPEIYGAEHLLMRRAASEPVRQRLADLIAWWESYAARNGSTLDNNPSVGNKVGGLTTIYEKSLGAVAKGGTSPLVDVLEYAQPIEVPGFVFMDSPGYDPVSVTGQVAGGCTLVCFTTGRGSAFGFCAAPSLKIASTSELYARMQEDMDFDAGQILDGRDMGEVSGELLKEIISVASGKRTRSEAQGIGEDEFIPWNRFGVL